LLFGTDAVIDVSTAWKRRRRPVVARQLDKETKEAILKALPEAYYQAGFDPVTFELQRLPLKNFNADRLEEIIEPRTHVLEVKAHY
jgi:hypothetical protein